MAISLVLVLGASAQASHMHTYASSALEHDAIGAVGEPDGRTTGVLGPGLTNCVLDLPPFEGRCAPDPVPRPSGALAGVVAPGCTGDGPARRPDGTCGLWTVGLGPGTAGTIPPPLSEAGMSGHLAPGAYTPTKAHAVRFLDGRFVTTLQAPHAPTTAVHVNRHLAEAERLAGLGALPDDRLMPGTFLLMPWYGQWTDFNGNGVVDALAQAPPTANEFAWLGSCTDFHGARVPASINAGTCAEDPNPNAEPPGAPCADPGSVEPCARATLDAWLFPGNHHTSTMALPDDMPGNQVVTWALQGFQCHEPSCDEVARDDYGDPLLDRQDEVNADVAFEDRTGEPADVTRQWASRRGGVTWSYGDDGLLVTLVHVTGSNCRSSPDRTLRVLPATCTFLDVDRHGTLSPGVEELLVGAPSQAPNLGLKGQLRGAWRCGPLCDDPGASTLRRLADSVVHGEDAYGLQQGPLLGRLDDLVLRSGWSREPNTADDRYPGARYRACSEVLVGDLRNPTGALDAGELEAQHRGWCNVGPGGDEAQAYAPHRQGPRGFLDVQLARNALFTVPVSVGASGCTSCVYGLRADLPYEPEPSQVPPSAEDHRRTLGPGAYYFQGAVGRWHDRASSFDESLWPDPPATTMVAYGSDGWVGTVQRDSGQWRYRGYEPRECATEADPGGTRGLHEAAECNPYLDGNVEDPQDYTRVEHGGEFSGACVDAGLFLALAPVDGSLDTQLLVWPAHGRGVVLDPLDLDGDGNTVQPQLRAYGPGPVEPLRLGARCVGDAAIEHADFLVWPEGNRGDDIVTRLSLDVPLGRDVDGDGAADRDPVTDADRYAAWLLPGLSAG